MTKFRDAQRVQTSLLSRLEKKALVWMAERTPRFINSDHLTALGLVAMFGAGFSYWLTSANPALGLTLATLCLALNWLGDSLDGTLARVRNHLRPRYGFYVDHVVDMLGALSLLGGLALSRYMSAPIACGLVIAFFMLSINCYLATYTLGKFQISFGGWSPTELRILLAIGNAFLYWKPEAIVFGQKMLVFDVGGAIGIAGMTVLLLASIARNTSQLYREEPIA
ncbi:MAG TPA: CDP-alcohol phosphatidyltransferase family protein [Bryobacteraceae bacterium]|nr:CDP-alcohol phosphatidyltransferase family protein [Bryobacteraceae bacterium]